MPSGSEIATAVAPKIGAEIGDIKGLGGNSVFSRPSMFSFQDANTSTGAGSNSVADTANSAGMQAKKTVDQASHVASVVGSGLESRDGGQPAASGTQRLTPAQELQRLFNAPDTRANGGIGDRPSETNQPGAQSWSPYQALFSANSSFGRDGVTQSAQSTRSSQTQMGADSRSAPAYSASDILSSPSTPRGSEQPGISGVRQQDTPVNQLGPRSTGADRANTALATKQADTLPTRATATGDQSNSSPSPRSNTAEAPGASPMQRVTDTAKPSSDTNPTVVDANSSPQPTGAPGPRGADTADAPPPMQQLSENAKAPTTDGAAKDANPVVDSQPQGPTPTATDGTGNPTDKVPALEGKPSSDSTPSPSDGTNQGASPLETPSSPTTETKPGDTVLPSATDSGSTPDTLNPTTAPELANSRPPGEANAEQGQATISEDLVHEPRAQPASEIIDAPTNRGPGEGDQKVADYSEKQHERFVGDEQRHKNGEKHAAFDHDVLEVEALIAAIRSQLGQRLEARASAPEQAVNTGTGAFSSGRGDHTSTPGQPGFETNPSPNGTATHSPFTTTSTSDGHSTSPPLAFSDNNNTARSATPHDVQTHTSINSERTNMTQSTVERQPGSFWEKLALNFPLMLALNLNAGIGGPVGVHGQQRPIVGKPAAAAPASPGGTNGQPPPSNTPPAPPSSSDPGSSQNAGMLANTLGQQGQQQEQGNNLTPFGKRMRQAFGAKRKDIFQTITLALFRSTAEWIREMGQAGAHAAEGSVNALNR